MITDLTPTQTISIGVAIALTTLIFLAVLLTIAYIEEIRTLLIRTGILLLRVPQTDFRTTPFPCHYVDPYTTQPRQTVGQTGVASACLTMTCTSCHQHTTTIQVASSNEYFLSQEDIPRSATPGPSRVWRSPKPTEVQQSLPERLRIWPARQGPTFSEEEGGIPYINH